MKPANKTSAKKPVLILVCGLPGTGKTTVAEAIAKKAGARILSTDILRKEITGRPSYSEAEKGMVYGMLFSMAEMMLRGGSSVLLDGTFYKRDLRKTAEKIASATKSGFRLVEVVCDEKTIRKRLKERSKTCSASDADFNVYRKVKKVFEPIKEKHFVVDTGENWKKRVDALLERL